MGLFEETDFSVWEKGEDQEVARLNYQITVARNGTIRASPGVGI